jgi:hypothetical protein
MFYEFWVDIFPDLIICDNILRTQNILDVEALWENFIDGMCDGFSEIQDCDFI